MSGVVFADKSVVYNGSAFSIEATNLPNGVSVEYENNGKTDAGVYTVTAKFTGNQNYNLIADKTATLTVAKATYDMSGVVFADKSVVYNGSAFSIEATNLPNGVSVEYENNGKTDAGVYTVTAKFTGNQNYNLIADKTATLTVAKATYDMSGVVFADKSVVYNGSAFSIEATNLPNGVSVEYENNGKTDAGVYTVTAKFTGNQNYNLIADKTAVLVIKTATLVFDTNSGNDVSDDIVISAVDGIDPTKQLVVELVEVEKDAEDYQEFLTTNQKVAVAYDIKLLKDGATVQPDGTLQFKVLIPTELVGKNFSIIHIHNGSEVSELEYQVHGGYALFESDKLSEFIFVYDMGSLLWIVIALAVIAALEVAFLLFLAKKKAQFKNVKMSAMYPPFVFGMFVPEWHITLIIALAVAVAALAVVDIIYAVRVLSAKGNCVCAAKVACPAEMKKPESEKPFEATVSEADSSCITETTVFQEETTVSDEQSFGKAPRIRKSFSDRLNGSKQGVAEYYTAIKDELLSYKKVKSKISFNHESFRIGKSIIARLRFRGKTLCLYLALDPTNYENTKFKVENMKEVGSNQDVPTMYKITLPRRVEYSKILIADLMQKHGTEKAK